MGYSTTSDLVVSIQVVTWDLCNQLGLLPFMKASRPLNFWKGEIRILIFTFQFCNFWNGKATSSIVDGILEAA